MLCPVMLLRSPVCDQLELQTSVNNLNSDIVISYYFGNFSFTGKKKITVKYAGAAAMDFVSTKMKKKYNVTDEHADLYEAA